MVTLHHAAKSVMFTLFRLLQYWNAYSPKEAMLPEMFRVLRLPHSAKAYDAMSVPLPSMLTVLRLSQL